MRLAETQARLWPAITEKRNDALGHVIRADPRLSPERRVEIYAQMYLWRQVEALKEDFPKLAILLGADAFVRLVEAYVRAYPSQHPSLGKLGRKLAQFLAEDRSEGGRPDLVDLAALEGARAEVFVERDARSAPAAVFSQLTPGQFAQARCGLSPALRILALQHDAAALWRAIENEEPAPAPRRLEQYLLVWRKGWQVYHAAIDADEAQALEWARAGRSLGEVCEAFAEREEPATAAFAALQSWVAEELVTAVEPA